MNTPRVQVLIATTAGLWGGPRAIASPNPAMMFAGREGCLAGETYRFNDGTVEYVYANDVFENRALDRAGGTLKLSLLRCAADAGSSIRGKVSARFRVGPDGKTFGAKIAGIASRSVRDCGVGNISTLELPGRVDLDHQRLAGGEVVDDAGGQRGEPGRVVVRGGGEPGQREDRRDGEARIRWS